MKKVKLKESDIENLVKKIIKEERRAPKNSRPTSPRLRQSSEEENEAGAKHWYDSNKRKPSNPPRLQQRSNPIEEEQTELDFGYHDQDEMNDVWDRLNKLNNDEIFDLMELTFNDEKMSVEDFVNNLPTYMGFEYDHLVSVLKQIKEEGI